MMLWGLFNRSFSEEMGHKNEPAVGFEPTTHRLQSDCSATELHWLTSLILPLSLSLKAPQVVAIRNQIRDLNLRTINITFGGKSNKTTLVINPNQEQIAFTLGE
jgi:hypothetical protein